MSPNSQTTAGILYGIGAGALWGLVFLAPELTHGFSPVHLTISRYLFYGLISVVLLIPRWRIVLPRVTRSEWIGIGSLALIGNLLYYTLLSTAVQLGGITMTSLVIGFLPVTITIIGSRDQNAVPLRKLSISLLLSIAGVFCIGWQTLTAPANSSNTNPILGFLCAIGALVTWTWFAVSNSRWLVRLQQITAQDWNLLTGIMTGTLTIAFIPVAIQFNSTDHATDDWIRLVSVAAGLAFFASILGNALWNRMSQLLPLTLVGQMILFETMFALLYGFIWEKRFPAVLETLAFSLVALSVVSCLRAHRKPLLVVDHTL